MRIGKDTVLLHKFFNPGVILCLLTGLFIVVQLYFYKKIEASSSLMYFRLLSNTILILLLALVSWRTKYSRICFSLFYLFINVLYVLLTVYIGYFKNIPTLFSIKLMGQAGEVSDSIFELLNLDYSVMLSGSVFCVFLYLF